MLGKGTGGDRVVTAYCARGQSQPVALGDDGLEAQMRLGDGYCGWGHPHFTIENTEAQWLRDLPKVTMFSSWPHLWNSKTHALSSNYKEGTGAKSLFEESNKT